MKHKLCAVIIGDGVNHFCLGRKYFSEAQAAEKRRTDSLRMCIQLPLLLLHIGIIFKL